jgi:hypothetical protein
MSEPRKTIKPILKEAAEDQNLPKLQIEIQTDPKNLAKTGLSPEEHYLQRKMDKAVPRALPPNARASLV